MGYIKCPRCELNYMPDTERYCQVCKREMRGEDEHEELELCSACGEHPVVPGDTFESSCEITRVKKPFYFATGKGYVGDKLCVTAEFSFALIEGEE